LESRNIEIISNKNVKQFQKSLKYILVIYYIILSLQLICLTRNDIVKVYGTYIKFSTGTDY